MGNRIAFLESQGGKPSGARNSLQTPAVKCPRSPGNVPSIISSYPQKYWVHPCLRKAPIWLLRCFRFTFAARGAAMSDFTESAAPRLAWQRG
ncbi:hypothetical protein LSM04_003413 [Trypanosoma melophagium]|uniref:uncharacterized protein n=1 Tax=Trypanosoma melophagium TaxID=715481 RepID=UPI00351A8649|nr:hypothetical protein LSM04_003413 [Trypanosoma melophagium]